MTGSISDIIRERLGWCPGSPVIKMQRLSSAGTSHGLISLPGRGRPPYRISRIRFP